MEQNLFKSNERYLLSAGVVLLLAFIFQWATGHTPHLSLWGRLISTIYTIDGAGSEPLQTFHYTTSVPYDTLSVNWVPQKWLALILTLPLPIILSIITVIQLNEYILLKGGRLSSIYFFFALMLFLPSSWWDGNASLSASLFLSMSGFFSLSTYKKNYRPDVLYLSGCMGGLAFLLLPPLLYFVPIAIYALYVLKALSLRHVLAFLLGILTPVWLVLPALILFVPGFDIAEWFEKSMLAFDPLWNMPLTAWEWGYLIFFALLAVISRGLLYLHRHEFRVSAYTRLRAWYSLVWMGLGGALLFGPFVWSFLFIALPGMVVFCSCSIALWSIKSKRRAFRLLTALILLTAVSYLGSSFPFF